MSDDLLLKELAQVIRDREAEERSRLDERWDRLSAGTLSPEEEAELKALAETSEEARNAYEAFRPLGPEFHAKVVQEISKRGLVPAPKPEPLPPPKPLPFRLTFRRAGWSAAAAAMAATVLIYVQRPSLSDYSMDEISSVSTMRGNEPVAGVPLLAPGDRFQTILRPETEVSRTWPLDAQIFLSRGPELRRLEVQPKIDPSGSVKVDGTVDRDIQEGSWILWAVVGRRGKLPAPAELQRFSQQAQIRQKDWVALAKEIRIQNRDLPP